MPAEQLAAGGSGKADGRKPDINAGEKSDARVVPMNDPNNGVASKPTPAEGQEGRRAAERNAEQSPAPRTQSRTRASMGLDGVREAACLSASSRHDSRQEPYAVAPHVRICAGGGGQPPSLPRSPSHAAQKREWPHDSEGPRCRKWCRGQAKHPWLDARPAKRCVVVSR